MAATGGAGTLIITGHGRGIGAATAQLAGGCGYSVCVNYLRDEAAAASVVRQIQHGGGKAIAVGADISSEADVVRLFGIAERELGPVAALTNSAATLEPQVRPDSMDAARFGRMFATNVIGTMLCAREAVRRMSTRHGGKGGAIVNVS